MIRQPHLTTGCGIYITIVTAIHANGTTADVDSGTFVYRTHGTGTIDIANYLTTIDSNSGIMAYTARLEVILRVIVIFIRTATCTIHVATIWIVIVFATVGYSVNIFRVVFILNIFSCIDTNGSAVYFNLGIMVSVTVLTTAIDRTFNGRTISGIVLCSNLHFSIINPC